MILEKEDIDLIEKSQYFDCEWYAARYSESFAGQRALSPAQHYLAIGWACGKNPGPLFDGISYSIRESLSGVNPLLYYERYGKAANSVLEFVPCVQVKLYDVEFEKDGVYVALSAERDKTIFLSANGKRIYPVSDFPQEHQRCFNSYLAASGERLLLFKMTDRDMENRVFVFTESEDFSVDLVISNFVNMYRNTKTDKYITVKNDSFTFTNRKGFEKYALDIVKDDPAEQQFFIDLRKKKKRKYNLYIETLDNHNDNAYKMFLYDLNVRKNNDAYFVTSKIAYDNETDIFLKSHYLVLNSQEFKDYMLRAKKIIVSWWCFPVYGYARSIIGYPFFNYNFYFVPHGISCDKGSYYLHYYNFGHTEKVFCCSQYEKQYLEECNGYDNVYLSGYPRMDKWYDSEIKKDTVMLFPTWRENIQDLYLQEIYRIMQGISEEYPEKRIVYAAHPSIPANVYKKITSTASRISKEIICISTLESALFNKYFGEAEYLITDYSSVAYDFSYKSGGYAVYYEPLAQIDAKYEIRPVFYEINCGITAESLSELIKVIGGDFDSSQIETRKQKFFAYIDNGNTNRVLSEILRS